jgi:uncharacterized protein (DUF1330 family)
MPAYIVLNIDVTDPERFAEYVKTGAPTLAQYGGRYLVRGGRAEKLEGSLEPKRVVVIAFDSAERARREMDKLVAEKLRKGYVEA